MLICVRRYAVLSSTILLGACATAVPVHTADMSSSLSSSSDLSTYSADKGAIPDSVISTTADTGESNCAYISRDLSVPWSGREYWCGSSKAAPVDSLNDTKKVQEAVEQTRRRLAVLRERLDTITRRSDYVFRKINPAAHRVDYVPESGAASDAIVQSTPSHIISKPMPADQFVSVPVETDPPPSTAISESVATNNTLRVLFASGREVLGPHGRSQALASDLLSSVRKASHITLRGALSDGEFILPDVYASERRSVGRSLSIRELWRASGLDVSSVSILHYSPDLSGKFVEVVIHD